MKNLRASDFKAFWENDLGIKFGAWLWTPKGKDKPVWCLCYDGFSYGRNECPLIKDYFETLNEAVEYSESVTERRFK